MKRAIWVYLIVFCLLAIFGGFTWLTRHPDAAILQQAESWEAIGPWVSRFREVYRTPEARGAGSETASELGRESEMESVDAGPPRVFDAYVWVLAGMELKTRPAPTAATSYVFDKLSRAGKIENRGDWYHVSHHGHEGWVLLEGYDENAEIPYGERPGPPLPVPSRPPDAERLAAARQYLGGGERVAAVGPYILYTDLRTDELIGFLDTVAGQLESVYVDRYGRRPLGEPEEAVVIYRSDIAYRLLQQQTERIAGLDAAGHNSKGVAVLFSGGRSREEVAATVAHELVHFLNRRAVGPQLPPWLDEGLAEDLAMSRFDDAGRIHPRELGGRRLKRGDEVRFEGAYGSLFRLRQALADGSLPKPPELLSADWESFVKSPDIQLHYATAAFLIRYLVEGEGGRHAAGFRAFLNRVAGGAPPTAATLQAELGENWSLLNARFRASIEQRAASSELPAGDG